MIDEESSASGQDYATDRSAIGAGFGGLGQFYSFGKRTQLIHAPRV